MSYKFEIKDPDTSNWIELHPEFNGQSMTYEREEGFIFMRYKQQFTLRFKGDDYDALYTYVLGGNSRLICKLSENLGSVYEKIHEGYLNINKSGAVRIPNSKYAEYKVETLDEYTNILSDYEKEMPITAVLPGYNTNVSIPVYIEFTKTTSELSGKWSSLDPLFVSARLYMNGRILDYRFVYDEASGKSYAKWNDIFPWIDSYVEVVNIGDEYTVSSYYIEVYRFDDKIVFYDSRQIHDDYSIGGKYIHIAGWKDIKEILTFVFTKNGYNVYIDENSFAFIDNNFSKLLIGHNEVITSKLSTTKTFTLKSIFDFFKNNYNAWWYLEKIEDKYYLRFDELNNIRIENKGKNFRNSSFIDNSCSITVEQHEYKSTKRTNQLPDIKTTVFTEDFKGLDVEYPETTSDNVNEIKNDIITCTDSFAILDGICIMEVEESGNDILTTYATNGPLEKHYNRMTIDDGTTQELQPGDRLIILPPFKYRFTASIIGGVLTMDEVYVSSNAKVSWDYLNVYSGAITIYVERQLYEDGQMVMRNNQVLGQDQSQSTDIDLNNAFGIISVKISATPSAGFEIEGFKITADKIYDVTTGTGLLSGYEIQNNKLAQSYADENFLPQQPFAKAIVNGEEKQVEKMPSNKLQPFDYAENSIITEYIDQYGIHKTDYGDAILHKMTKNDLNKNKVNIELLLI